MSQNNFRKEPAFGEPSVKNSAEKAAEPALSETGKSVSSLSVSLHSNKAPNYTFTPIMKRSVDASTPLKSIEESQMANNTETPKSTETPIDTETPKTASAASASAAAGERAKSEVKTEKTATEEKPAVNANNVERVIPAASAKTESSMISASKYRRLGLVAILAAVLGGIFFWLKPSAPETVEELQSRQGGSLPIEFRPVDEEEAKRVEAQAKAEQEALARQQAQQAQQAAQQVQQAQQNVAAPATQAPATVAEGAQQPSTTTQGQIAPPSADTPVSGAPADPNAAVTAAPPASDPNAMTESASGEQPPVAVKPPVTPQPEKKAAKKGETKSKVKAITADEYNAKKAKNAQMDQLVKNVETQKPTSTPKASASKSAAVASNDNGIVSVKSMSVPKSTSLMQVFRDNKLNISDVNAMSKTNNMVSNLKAGERVTVRLDKNNRVVEMSVGSGGKFTRRADGSYSFSK